MIVLHAGIETGRFLLWGEVARGDASASIKRRRQLRSRSRSAPVLPYDAGESGLNDALQTIATSVIRPRKAEAVNVWLPTVAGLPMASSTLIAEYSEKVAGASLSPWQISALHLDTAAAADLLCACINQQILAPGIIIGRDLAFWAQAMRFAGAMVAKQQFLPGIQVIERTYIARWQPILAGRDAQRRKTLIKAMPQVCRALSRQTDAPPATVASSLLDHFLEEMVDHLVRSSMPTLPRMKPKSFESLHDQWLFALRWPDGGEMTGDDSELAALAEQVNEWRRPVEVSADAPFRLCFRLEEPKADAEVESERRRKRLNDSWYVRYLQAGAGRSLAQKRLSRCADRHAGRKQCRRSVVDHGVSQPRLSRQPGPLQARLLRSNSGQSR